MKHTWDTHANNKAAPFKTLVVSFPNLKVGTNIILHLQMKEARLEKWSSPKSQVSELAIKLVPYNSKPDHLYSKER